MVSEEHVRLVATLATMIAASRDQTGSRFEARGWVAADVVQDARDIVAETRLQLAQEAAELRSAKRRIKDADPRQMVVRGTERRVGWSPR